MGKEPRLLWRTEMNLNQFKTYQKAAELVTAMVEATEGLPRGYGWLRDQARRAAASVPLNDRSGQFPSRPNPASSARGRSPRSAAIRVIRLCAHWAADPLAGVRLHHPNAGRVPIGARPASG